MCVVPTMANALLNCPGSGELRHVSSMREINLAARRLTPELIERLEKAFQLPRAAGYGLDGDGPVATSARHEDPRWCHATKKTA